MSTATATATATAENKAPVRLRYATARVMKAISELSKSLEAEVGHYPSIAEMLEANRESFNDIEMIVTKAVNCEKTVEALVCRRFSGKNAHIREMICDILSSQEYLESCEVEVREVQKRVIEMYEALENMIESKALDGNIPYVIDLDGTPFLIKRSVPRNPAAPLDILPFEIK